FRRGHAQACGDCALETDEKRRGNEGGSGEAEEPERDPDAVEHESRGPGPTAAAAEIDGENADEGQHHGWDEQGTNAEDQHGGRLFFRDRATFDVGHAKEEDHDNRAEDAGQRGKVQPHEHLCGDDGAGCGLDGECGDRGRIRGYGCGVHGVPFTGLS
ncbi:hypothetical protein ADL26_16930, partial [Thermoactinomyces vulgaris]